MAPPRSDKALRRLVADLADARPEDIEAVLDELPSNQRRTVRSLLDAYLGRPASTARSNDPAGLDLVGFSPAIRERLTARSTDRQGDWRMTPAALDILRQCASRLEPMAAPVTNRSPQTRGFAERWLNALSGGRGR